MNELYVDVEKDQRIQAVSQSAERATDPRMKEFWMRAHKKLIRNLNESRNSRRWNA